jgi:Protein of unknown function (DUF2868)
MTVNQNAGPHPVSRLHRLLLSEAIRRCEERSGTLPDQIANLIAQQSGPHLVDRIQARALELARDGGQWEALIRWLRGARLAALGLGILAIVSGIGFTMAALGDGSRPVNLAWALGCLLGPHTISLILWLITLKLRPGHSGVLSRWWLALSAIGHGHAGSWVPSLGGLREGPRASRWLFAVLTHTWWSLALLSAALTAVGLLLVRRYDFIWETTLLASNTFVAITHHLGALPALLGFVLPDEAMIRATNTVDVETARHAWAGWLVGVLIVYGLLPRVALALFSEYRWIRAKLALQLDLQQPGYALLRDRLAPETERLGVCDPDTDPRAASQQARDSRDAHGAVLVAIELDDDRTWPPPLSNGILDAGIVDSREQRQHLRTQLSDSPAARLVIAVDPRRSPDRGTLSLIQDLATHAGQTRVCLLPPPPGTNLDPLRMADWISALQRSSLAHTTSLPLSWLESGDE